MHEKSKQNPGIFKKKKVLHTNGLFFKRCFCEFGALDEIPKEPTSKDLNFGTRRGPGNTNRRELYPW